MFDFKYEIEVSTKPEKAIGDDIFWEKQLLELWML